MPTYEFQCGDCGLINEHVCKISELSDSIPCKCCCGSAHRILSLLSGQTSQPSWLNDELRNVLQKDGEKPIETRKELRTYCDKHGFVCTG